MAERETSQSENIGVVRSRLECPASQIETFAAVNLQVVHPIVRREELTRVGNLSATSRPGHPVILTKPPRAMSVRPHGQESGGADHLTAGSKLGVSFLRGRSEAKILILTRAGGIRIEPPRPAQRSFAFLAWRRREPPPSD
jgi:hypothetical protein